MRKWLGETPHGSVVRRDLVRRIEVGVPWVNVRLVRHDRFDRVARSGESEPSGGSSVVSSIDARGHATEVIGASTPEGTLTVKRAWSAKVPGRRPFPHAWEARRCPLDAHAAPLGACR